MTVSLSLPSPTLNTCMQIHPSITQSNDYSNDASEKLHPKWHEEQDQCGFHSNIKRQTHLEMARKL